MLSLATNVCPGDEGRIRTTVPHWLRTLGNSLDELLVVIDTVPPRGRIASLHGSTSPSYDMHEILDSLTRLDSRVRMVELPPPDGLRPVLDCWFRSGRPVRCQAGTPIAAFVYAAESAQGEFVLRVDCDMLFTEQGWVKRGVELLSTGTLDLVEPPRLGGRAPSQEVSSRALLICPRLLRSRLPIEAHRLDPLRRIHRRLGGRTTWVAFEQMLQKEVQCGRLRHAILDHSLGHSMHVATRDEMSLIAQNLRILRAFEERSTPGNQRDSWNFVPSAW